MYKFNYNDFLNGLNGLLDTNEYLSNPELDKFRQLIQMIDGEIDFNAFTIEDVVQLCRIYDNNETATISLLENRVADNFMATLYTLPARSVDFV